jgi:acetyl-CoA carboxylase carboxyl transferase subunit beta
MPLFGKRQYTSIKVKKKDLPPGLWTKCPQCEEIVYKEEIDRNCGVCPVCSYHFRINWKERLKLLVEENSFEEWDKEIISGDPLSFVSYRIKLDQTKAKLGISDAVITGKALMEEIPVAIGIMEFAFIGGSMGSVVGEKVTRLIERAIKLDMPVVICSATGGARMQEGMLSLMQMAKTSAAISKLSEKGLPYISVLTDPSTAGVMASYATLGDVIIAEPGALVGFAGARVIRETTRENLPEGFQRAEFVLKHGLIDMIVERKSLKNTIVRLLRVMLKLPSAKPATSQNNGSTL